jgi:TP901 family phage tail tape measure protein
MAALGEGFVIPARVVVSVEGLTRVRAELESFVAASKSAAASGQRPIDPATGAQASVRKIQEETGAALNNARQAAQVIRQELGRTDVSTKRRKELEAELQVLKQLEAHVQKYTRGLRTEGGKVQPPIYPEGVPRYPTIAAQEKGKRAAPLPEPDTFRWSSSMLPTQKWQQQAEAARKAQWAQEAQTAEANRRAQAQAQAVARAQAQAAERTARLAQSRTAPEVAVSFPPRPRRTEASTTGAEEADRAAKAEAAATKRLNTALDRRAEIEYMLSAEGRKALAAEQGVITGRAQIKAVEEQIKAADREYLKATADSANAREDEANRIKMMRMGLDPGALAGQELRVSTALASRAAADRERAAIARRGATGELEAVDASARLRVEQRKLELAIRKRQQEIVLEQRQTGEIGRGSWFQRLQGGLKPASGKLPEEQLNLKQFVGDKFERTLGYAFSGMALGAGMAGISEMFRDAMQLEQTFVRLRGQLDGIGQSNAFEGMRSQISEIAKETGVASNQVGLMATRFLGIQGDPTQAAATSRQAAKLMTVTGLDERTTLESLVPVMKSFGISAEDVGNQVVAMGEKFGISEDDLTTFLGKTAITAKQAGLSFQELTALGSNLANSLGKPISSSAESINKSFALIENNAMKIIDVLRANPQTQGFIEQFSEQVGKGETGEALFTLLDSFKHFTASQRQTMLTSVVSKRESEEFNAMFENAQKIIDDSEQGAGQYAGRLNQRFDDLKNTVLLTFQTVKASLEALGDLLFKAGVADWAKDVGNALGFVVGSLSLLIGMFAKLNEIPIFGGMVSTLGRIAATTFLLVKLYGLFTATIRKASDATKEQTVTETANQGTKQRTVATNQALATSEREVAASRQTGAVPPVAGPAGRAPAAATGAIGGMPYAVSGGGKVAAAAPAVAGAAAVADRNALDAIARQRAATYRSAIAENAVNVKRTAELKRVMNAEVSSGLTTRFMDQQAKKRAAWLAVPVGAPGSYDAQRNLDRDTAGMQARQQAQRAAQAERARVMTAGTMVSGAERTQVYQREIANTIRKQRDAEVEKLRISRLPPPPLPGGGADVAAAQRTTLREQARAAGDARRARYLAQRALFTRDFARQAEETGAPIAPAGFGTRAIAGGRVLGRTPRADARLAATGQKAFGASPFLIGALVVAGAAAVKSAYDEQKGEVEAAAADMKLRLQKMNVDQLKEMGELRTSLVEDVAMTLFDVVPPEQARRSELAFAESTEARKALGAPVRPVLSNLETANKKIETDKTAVEKQMAERFGPKNRSKLLYDLIKGKDKADATTDKLVALGLVDERSKGLFGKKLFSAKPGNIEGFANLIKESTTPEAEGATPPEWKSIVNQRVFDELKNSAPDLIGRSRDLSTAAGAVKDLQEGNTSIDEWFVNYAKDTGSDQGISMKKIEELNRDFESGRITQAQYLGELKRRLPDIQQQARVSAPGSTIQTQSSELADQIQKQIRRVEVSAFDSVEGLRGQLKAMGSLTPKKIAAESLGTKALQSDINEQYEMLPQLVEADLAATEEMWNMIADPDERLAAMNQGAKYSAATREVFLKKSASSNSKADAAIKKIAKITGQDEGKIREQLARQAAQEGKSLEAVATEYIDKQIAFYGEAKKHGNLENAAESAKKYNELSAARSEFIGALAEVPDIPIEDPDPAKQRVNTIQINAVKRKLAREEQSIGIMGDSVAVARLNAAEAWDSYRDTLEQSDIFGAGVKKEDVQKAKIEAMKADRAVADSEFAASQRVLNRAMILANGDPVRETEVRIGIAQRALGYAQRMGNKDDAEAAVQELMGLQQQTVENQLNIRRATMQRELAIIQEDPMAAALKQVEMAELEVANAKGDADRKAKEGALITAQQNASRAFLDIIRGGMNLAAAVAAEDPMESAKLALQAAEFELAHAHGDADRQQKEAGVVQARQRLNNTISSALTADANLAITLANLRGDTVGAATEAATNAKRLLDEAIAKGITDRNVLAPLEGAVAESAKQLYLAPINKQISDLDYLYALEQTSLGEYVSMLEGKLSLLVYDSQEYRDLNMKIFQLKKSASQDIGFNVPGEIQLPTLYEARRLNQSNAMGVGYMDNRNVQMTFNVNGAQDPALVASTIVSALQTAGQTGGQIYTPGVSTGVFN